MGPGGGWWLGDRMGEGVLYDMKLGVLVRGLALRCICNGLEKALPLELGNILPHVY